MASSGSGSNLGFLSAIVIVSGIVGVTAWFALRDGSEGAAVGTIDLGPSPVAAAPEASDPVEEAPSVAEAPVAVEPEAAPETAAEPAPMRAPTFSTVRVAANGDALVSGVAVPGATVEILLDGVSMAEATAGGAGEFVLFAFFPPKPVERIMTLRATLSDESRESDEMIIVDPIEEPPVVAEVTDPVTTPESAPMEEPAEVIAEVAVPSEEAPESVTPESSPEEVAALEVAPETPEAPTAEVTTAREATAEADVSEDSAPTPEETVASAETATTTTTAAETEPEAPRLLLADEDGLTVLQSPDAMANVALDTITYTEAGDVSLGGRAAGEGFVRIYIDDQPVTTSRIGEDGTWRTALPDVDTGVYTLRVDEVASDGEVTSRVETPFRREDPEVIAEIQESPVETGPITQDVLTVQPGATLWAIARERYGEGQLYVKVFEANTDRIRDPDLIYPGQVFDLPD